ncbi:MAG TPA: Asd/ArgC dimerization domain-containing protein [Terriglobia bacterium]|nr:Asd/ArgC dimerization domain-containing protein [Terriglobia bacterium]
MKNAGYDVAVIGASTLLGKELLEVIEERKFPVAKLMTISGETGEPDLPIVELSRRRRAAADYEEIPARFDFAFVAAEHQGLASWMERADRVRQGVRAVIDLCSSVSQGATAPLRIPLIEGLSVAAQPADESKNLQVIAAPHAATLVTSVLLLRLAARFRLRTAVAQIFSPASEIGPRAIDELQKQTVNLLSFQKVPREAFGAQIAFNLLPRLGTGLEKADGVESRVRNELTAYLGGHAPVPAIRLIQVPVFYSTAVSLYVETQERVPPSDLVAALDGAPVVIRRASDRAPSQADAAGSSEILVDAIQPDAAHPEGLWLWAVADNMRIAALNAVLIAEGLHRQRQPLHLLK